MILAQLHLNVGVGRADGRGGRVREIQRRVGQADVIQHRDHLIGRNLLPDRLVDVVAERGRLFDARSGAGADVNLELAGVHRGKEILAQKRRQQAHRAEGEEQEEDQKDRRVIHAERQQAQIAVAKALKTCFKALLKADERVSAAALPLVSRRRRAL